jgi:PAS domain S-box-containing protein
VAGLGLSVAAAAIAASSPFAAAPEVAVVAHVLVVAAPVGAGLYAILRQRATRFGWLLVIAGLLSAPTVLAETGNSPLYSIGRVDVWLVELMVVYLVLAFPSGRLHTGVDKALFGVGAGLLAVLYLPTALLVDGFTVPTPWSGCETGCPSNAFMLSGSEPGVIDDVVIPLRDIAFVALMIAVASVLVYRVTHGTRLMRRMLAPVLTFAIVRIGLAALFVAMRRAAPDAEGTKTVGVMALLATPALSIGFYAGLVRWRLFAVSAVRRLTTDFVGPSSGERVRDVLASAFEDPTLEIIYWAPDPGRWVDAAGTPVRIPAEGSSHAVTEVSDGGRRVAALVHDAALAEQPIISEVAGGFALVALENQRLEAELRGSLRELRESRARILSAADKERQRIERNLHDGAQQRLVALGIKLELAREHAAADPHDGSALLSEIASDVDDALAEVRALAGGVYPPLLADRGLADALKMAATGGPLATTVSAGDIGRYPQEIESAVYFCCLEALQNVAKHAHGASAVSITLSESGHGELRFEVRDDGPGFAPASGDGSGLANMRDRVAALGGSLTIDSAAGDGTCVAGRIPLAPVALPPELEPLLRRATDALEDCFGIFRALRDQRGAVVDLVVEHVNEAACRDLGHSREEETGRTLGQLVPGYKDSDAFRWHRHVLESDGPLSREDLAYVGPFEDASHLQRAYDVRGAPLGGDRLVLSWRDITKRKRAELDWRMQSVVLDRAAEGVCLIRASDAVIVYANPRYARIFGYEAGELDGRPVSVLNWEEQPGDAERRVQEIVEILEQRGEATLEVRNRCKNGAPIWTEAHMAGFDHPDHGTVWVTVQQEITERKRAGDALRSSEERLRAAVNRAPLVLFTLDRDLRYTWVFNNWVGMAGDQSAIGKTDAELFDVDAGRRLSSINRHVLRTGERVHTEIALELARGPATFDLAVEPLWDPDGKVRGVAGTAYELSERAASPGSGEGFRRFVRGARAEVSASKRGP